MKLNISFKPLYDKILWINNHIFKPIDIDARIETFIGIVGIIVAVVIFIAETMNANKIETQKRFILEKTKIKKTLLLSIGILVYCVLKELLPNSDKVIVSILYFFIELVFNVLIICSIYNTIRLFTVAIKLNTNSEYFNNKYDKYIETRLKIIHQRDIKNSNKKIKNNKTNEFIKNNNKYFTSELNSIDGYIPIKSSKNGVFKCYDCRILQTIVDKIENDKISNREYTPILNPIIVLPLKDREKINHEIPIAYVKKELLYIENDLKNSITFDDSIPYEDNEISLIVRDLYRLEYQNSKIDFSSNVRLLKFYNFLYLNDMHSLLIVSFEYIRKLFVKVYSNYNKNIELVRVMNSLSNLSYSNKDYEHYKFLKDYMYYCFREQLKIKKNKRKVAYDFINTVIRYDYYSAKENNDMVYYDILLANFMNFLFDLLYRKEFDAIEDLFENIIFDYNHIIGDEPDNYDILKMQFSFGFIYGLIVLSDKNIFNKNDKSSLKKIINYIKSSFVDIYDQIDVIYYFKKYYNKFSNIQQIYYNFDIRFEQKKYRNSWSGYRIDDILIIKEYIYLFNIKHSRVDEVKEYLKTKDNRYFYKNLLESVNSNEKSNLEKILDINFDNSDLTIAIEELLKFSKQDEEKFIKENELSEEKINKFKEAIYLKIEKGNELINTLKCNNKYLYSENLNKSYFGFNQFLNRDLFFDDVYGIETIARDYGNAIISGITKNYLKKLDSISKTSNKEFENYIKKLKSPEEYIIITSPLNWRIFEKFNYGEKTIKVGNKKIEVINIPKAKDIYLIKKIYLPEIYFQKIDVKDDNYYIKDNIYYQLIDCSKDKKKREEIQKNTEWLSEKGSKELQIEYLKENCVLKLFVAPLIKRIPYSTCIKFVVTNDDD